MVILSIWGLDSIYVQGSAWFKIWLVTGSHWLPEFRSQKVTGYHLLPEFWSQGGYHWLPVTADYQISRFWPSVTNFLRTKWTMILNESQKSKYEVYDVNRRVLKNSQRS